MPPFMEQYDNPFLPRRRPAVREPSLAPQAEEALLGNLMEGSLGGLAYVGKVLDKTFGGRALRGLIGGRPDELLSVLPGSDTLGITSETNEVSGRKILENQGLVTPGDDGLDNTLAGIAAEVALDPATFAGAAVPRLVGKGLLGGGRLAGAGIGAVTGFDPAALVGRAATRGYEAVKAPARALFDTDVAGTLLPRVQNEVAAGVFTPELKAGEQAAENQAADALARLRDYAQRTPDAQAKIDRALYQAGEGYASDAADTLGKAGFGPAATQNIIDLADELGTDVRGLPGIERTQGGVASKILEDLPTWRREENAAVEADNAAKIAANNQVIRDNAKNGTNLPLPFPNFQPAALPHQAESLYIPRTAAPHAGDDTSRFSGGHLTGASEFDIKRDDFRRGIPGGTVQLDDWARDPRLSGAARTLTNDHDVEQLLASHLLGQPIGAIPLSHPVYGQAKELSGLLKSLRPDALEKGLYNLDFVGNVKARKLESARKLASSKGAVQGVKSFARPIAELEQLGQPYVKIEDFLNSKALTHQDPLTGIPVSQEFAAKALGIDTTNPNWVQDLKGFAVPKDAADDIARMGQAWTVPASLAPVVDVYDKFTNLFKAGLTAPFPAFHVRNAISGIFNMWRDGVAPAAQITAGKNAIAMLRGGGLDPAVAAKLYPGLSIEAASNQLLKEAIANRIAFTHGGQTSDAVGSAVRGGMQARDLPGVGRDARSLTGDVGGFLGGFVPEKGKMGQGINPLNVAGVRGETDQFIPVAQGRKLGNTVEDGIRLTHYLAKRLEGATAAEAKLTTMKYQIDYSDLTEFERNVMKRLFPWYTFSRKNLPPLLEDLATKPRLVAGAVRGVTGSRDEGEFVPPYVAEGAATPIGGAPEGFKRYISSFGLPFEDEAVKTAGSILQGDPGRVAQQLFGMAQPFAKLPAEVATNTQMFSGRKLDELRPYEFTQLGGVLPEDQGRILSQVIANSPASRFFSSGDKLLDERKGLGPQALNALTGVKVTDVDVNAAKERASADLLKKLLRGEPGVRTREDVYIPKDKLPGLPQDELLLYDLLKEIESRQAAQSRARQAAAGR